MVWVLGAGAATCPHPSVSRPRDVPGRRTRRAAGEEGAEGRDRVLPCSGPVLPGTAVPGAAQRSRSPLTALSLLPVVVFPQDLLEKGLEADNFAMLGLGDIVIPGEDMTRVPRAAGG